MTHETTVHIYNRFFNGVRYEYYIVQSLRFVYIQVDFFSTTTTDIKMN